MATEFKNKRFQLEFSNQDEEIKVTGNVSIDATSLEVTDIMGNIYKISGEFVGDCKQGTIGVSSLDDIQYRTKASMLIDEVLSDAKKELTPTA